MTETDQRGDPAPRDQDETIWIRLLYTVILLLLFALAELVLWAATLLQIILRAVNGTLNPRIAEFGDKLGDWTRDAVRYLTGASPQKPFPWSDW